MLRAVAILALTCVVTGAQSGTEADEESLLKALRQACRGNDARRARNLLGQWVRRYGPPKAHGSLMEFAAGPAGADLGAQIRALDAGGFSAGPDENWRGGDLWKAFQAWSRQPPEEEMENGSAEFGLYTATRL